MRYLWTALLLVPMLTGAVVPTDTTDMRQFDLNEIVITGTRVPKLLKDTPVQTRLITSREIVRCDATNIQDLLQQEMPGLEFTSSMSQHTHFNFNGQGGQSVLFLVDGERLAGETMDDIDFARLNMNNVERIEIVKGASSALYGSNAAGGVINVITKNAVKPYSINLSARYSPRHNGQRYNLSIGNRGKYVENIFTAQRTSADSYELHSAPNPVTLVLNNAYGHQVWNFSDRLTVKPADNLRLSVRAGYFFREVPRLVDSPERYRDYSAGAKAVWHIRSTDVLEMSYSFDQYDKSDFLKRRNKDIRRYSNVQNSGRVLYNHYIDRGDVFTAGADVLRDYMMNTKLTGTNHDQVNADAFVQYDWRVSPKWEVVGAVRYDYFSSGNLSRFTPKISARFRPLVGLNFRAGYGMGFRAPTLKEKYYSFDAVGIWIINGNPELKPESSHNWTLSAEYTHGHFNYTISGYYNRIRNRIATGLPYALPADPKQLYLDYINMDKYSVGGAEVSVRGKWRNGLSASFTYAYTNEHLAKDRDGNVANNQYIPARKHSLTFRGDYERTLNKELSLAASISGRFLSAVDNLEYKDYYNIAAGTAQVHYPAYTMWKLSATATICTRLRVTVAVDNLFNYKPKYYYLNSPMTKGVSPEIGLTLDI